MRLPWLELSHLLPILIQLLVSFFLGFPEIDFEELNLYEVGNNM